MHVERAALQQVASLAADEGTGARGLVTILERTLRDHKYELPSSSIDEFTVTNATVVDPQAALRELLATQTTEHELELGLRDLKRFEKRLRRELAPLQVWLTDEATDELILQSRREHARWLCGSSGVSRAAWSRRLPPGALGVSLAVPR